MHCERTYQPLGPMWIAEFKATIDTTRPYRKLVGFRK
jgi:hypothetical protein